MKKYLVFGMMSAVALSFTACSSEEEVVVNNPTFDGTSVKTELAINLPSKVATRQTTAITQDGATTATWRGVNELYVAPFVTAIAADENPIKPTDVAKPALELAPFGKAFDHDAAQDKWYQDITVPIGTNAFLVYAKPTDNTVKAENGVLAMSEDEPFANLSALKFKLEPIAGDLDIATVGAPILAALNKLPVVTGLPNNADGATAKAWKDLSADTDNQFYAELYTIFSSLKAGSKTDVLAFLEEQLKPALITNTGAGADGIDAKLKTAVDEAIAAVNAADDFTATAGVPDGAAVLKCSEGVFSYVTTEFIAGNPALAWGQNVYTYPAELWYIANTGIRTANEIKSTTVGNQTWAEFMNAWTADKLVKASTQSVALVNPLQYGVGNLETKIKFAAENLVVTKKVVTDQAAGTVTEEEVESVPVNKLTLTGILVGDQKNVGWNFEPIEEEKAAVVYDTKLINTTFPATDFVTASQTLLCETHKDVVNIALEFKNETGAAFTGVDGIVPAGAKFYLIGQLDKSKGTPNGATWIFQQDFKTTANILVNKLQGTAYNNIPDLRSPKVELGLSVDLQWQKGYEFNVAIGE